jgi:hypothetical protein
MDERNAKTCEICGHPFNDHRVCGYGAPPTEGWITCPVEGCECHATWSLEPDVAAQIRASNPGAKSAQQQGIDPSVTPASTTVGAMNAMFPNAIKSSPDKTDSRKRPN